MPWLSCVPWLSGVPWLSCGDQVLNTGLVCEMIS